MQRDAEAHAAEDKRKRDLAEARNTAEQRVYQLEKLLDENKDKLSEADKSAVRAAIEKVNEAKKGDDPAAINQAVEDLQRASQAMAEHLYAGGRLGGRRRAGGPTAARGRGRPRPTAARPASPTTSSTSSSKRRSDASRALRGGRAWTARAPSTLLWIASDDGAERNRAVASRTSP